MNDRHDRAAEVLAVVVALIIILALCLHAGCSWDTARRVVCSACPKPEATATATPAVSTATPTPGIIVPGQALEGRAEFQVTGLSRLPFGTEDDFVLFVMEWEALGKHTPILGVHVRGKSFQDAGALIRWGANPGHDREVFAEHGDQRPDLYCGHGMNYHNRVGPISDGLWAVEWDARAIRIILPGGKTFGMPLENPEGKSLEGTMGFGGFRTRLKERRDEPYLLWRKFAASEHGVEVKLAGWKALADGFPARCP